MVFWAQGDPLFAQGATPERAVEVPDDQLDRFHALARYDPRSRRIRVRLSKIRSIRTGPIEILAGVLQSLIGLLVAIANDLGRRPADDGHRRHVAADHGSGPHDGSFAHFDPGRNRHLVANPDAIANHHVLRNPLAVVGQAVCPFEFVVGRQNQHVVANVDMRPDPQTPPSLDLKSRVQMDVVGQFGGAGRSQ